MPGKSSSVLAYFEKKLRNMCCLNSPVIKISLFSSVCSFLYFEKVLYFPVYMQFSIVEYCVAAIENI